MKSTTNQAASFINDPDRWPRWPLLPLQKRGSGSESGRTEYAVLMMAHPSGFHLFPGQNVWTFGKNKTMRELEEMAVTFATAEDVIDAGWDVD